MSLQETMLKRFTTRSIVTFTLIVSLVVIALVPIKWTPLVAVIPHPTWRQVSPVHLLQVVWKPLPSDVTPIKRCTRIKSPSISKAEVAESYEIRHFEYETALSRMAEVGKRDPQTDFRVFLPILDKNTKITLLQLYLVMADALNKAGIEHVLLHGSVLGIQRFSGISPWDDDLDVAIKVKHWREVRDTLSCIKGFELYVDPEMRWNFFHSDSIRSSTTPHKKYPFIDIFLQEEDDTHVWGIHWVNRQRSIFPKHFVYPVKWSYMDGIRVPIPKDPLKVLEIQYGDLSLCASQENSHLVESPVKGVVTIPCSKLFPVYGNFSIRPE